MVESLQIINNTGTINIGSVNSEWLILTAPIIAAIIGYFTIQYFRKQHIQSALTDVFRLLSSNENKQAEDNLIQAYKKQDLYDGDSIQEKYKEDCNIIRRNYYKIGVLISENVVPAYPFYITFGYKLVQLYAICQKEIETGQKDYRLFAAYFTNLAIDSLNFHLDNPDIPPIKDPLGNEITRGQLGSKIDISKKKRKWFS